jgi:hypothetical protein
MAQTAENRKVSKKQYVAPKLQAYGLVRELTQALSQGSTECGNNGHYKGCSLP